MHEKVITIDQETINCASIFTDLVISSGFYFIKHILVAMLTLGHTCL